MLKQDIPLAWGRWDILKEIQLFYLGNFGPDFVNVLSDSISDSILILSIIIISENKHQFFGPNEDDIFSFNYKSLPFLFKQFQVILKDDFQHTIIWTSKSSNFLELG